MPKHYHTLTKKQKDQLLESYIFVEEKRDGTIKARKGTSNVTTLPNRMLVHQP